MRKPKPYLRAYRDPSKMEHVIEMRVPQMWLAEERDPYGRLAAAFLCLALHLKAKSDGIVLYNPPYHHDFYGKGKVDP